MPPNTAVSAGAALTDNLRTLGKMQRGDMLAAADAGGRLVRKTNWITQKHNTSRTHDAALFDQIDEILGQAEFAAEGDLYPEPQVDEFRSLYVKAVKGLETLLQTYRSKGSKETDLIDRLTLVLVEHAKNIEESTKSVDQGVDSLMATAERAIKYVNDCRIRSVNNNLGGVGMPYYDRDWDQYLFALLVRGFSGNHLVGNRTVRDLKTVLLDLTRQPISRREKRRQLAAKLNEWFGGDGGLRHLRAGYNQGYRDFEDRWEEVSPLSTDYDAPWRERQRHKLARRALRTRFGNCTDKAAIVATHIVEATRGQIGICRVSGMQYDHSWVLISRRKDELIGACMALENGRRGRRALPRDTVVVDGWTRDWWKLRNWFNSICNPRQITVRRRIRNEIDTNGQALNEPVRWPPHADNKYFRLRYGHLTLMDQALLGPQFTWQHYQDAANKLRACAAQLSQVLSPAIVHRCLLLPDVDAVEDSLRGGARASQARSVELGSNASYQSSAGSLAGHGSFGGHHSSMIAGHSSVGSHHSSFRPASPS